MYLEHVQNVARRIKGGMAVCWTTVASVALAGSTLSAVELRVPRMAVASGTTADASITYTSDELSIVGLQCDLKYDQNAVTIMVTTGSSGLAIDKVVQTVVLPNGNLRLMMLGLDQTVIPDGTVVSLKILVSPDAVSGVYMLRCDNAVGVTSDGEQTEINTRQGRIFVIPAE